MYPWTTWQDEVVESPANYLIDGEDHTIEGNHGETLQEGTPQDEDNFNNLECGMVDAHLATLLLLNYAREMGFEIEQGTVTLTNSATFPFNDSAQTVALETAWPSSNYNVLTEVADFEGNVGEVEVSDKLVNGFKLSYSGSAPTATINYTVIGGYLK